MRWGNCGGASKSLIVNFRGGIAGRSLVLDECDRSGNFGVRDERDEEDVLQLLSSTPKDDRDFSVGFPSVFVFLFGGNGGSAVSPHAGASLRVVKLSVDVDRIEGDLPFPEELVVALVDIEVADNEESPEFLRVCVSAGLRGGSAGDGSPVTFLVGRGGGGFLGLVVVVGDF